MRIKTFPLMLALLFSLANCLSSDSLAAPAEKELTILVYICGTDLESDDGQASGDIREMISSGIGGASNVNVLLATGGCSQWQQYGISSRNVQYYRLGNQQPELLKDVGRSSMGDASTLSSFLSYGLSSAPARRYILILWDHGGGPVYGVCNDANYQDDSLSLAELKTGLNNGLKGKKLDIIGFDCCLMNCVDLCSDLYGIADYSVLSQELVTGNGLNYDGWMEPVALDPGISTELIAKSMAETYVAENSKGRYAETATMSVVSSENMPAVMDAANSFSAALTELTSTNLAGVVRQRSKLKSFGEFIDYDASDLVDVEDMCDEFTALLPQESAALKAAAEQAVRYNFTTADISDYAHGLSFFLPYSTISSEGQEIISHYSNGNSAYSDLVIALTNQSVSSGYMMSASSSVPSAFYSENDDGCTGSFCDIWDGYYGDYCSFEEVYDFCDGNIWAGLEPGSGSIWDGYASATGIWSGFDSSITGTYTETDSSSGSIGDAAGNIWAGLEESSSSSAVSVPENITGSASTPISNIWAGLLNSGSEYYQPGEENANVQAGISEAVSAESILAEAGAYFSSSALKSQMIYSLQLTREDLDHLSTASGVLNKKDGNETIRLGNMGKTTIDWSTGLIFSMFDGSWPMLNGQMVRAEYLYKDDSGNIKFVIPALVNGLQMYLLGNQTEDGKTEILGATQGYDESGFAIRGSIPLEPGMLIIPLFTSVSADGSENLGEGQKITVPSEGLSLVWEKIPAGEYEYCFALKDLAGDIHYTDSVKISF